MHASKMRDTFKGFFQVADGWPGQRGRTKSGGGTWVSACANTFVQAFRCNQQNMAGPLLMSNPRLLTCHRADQEATDCSATRLIYFVSTGAVGRGCSLTGQQAHLPLCQ
jgi:hypothetical protein